MVRLPKRILVLPSGISAGTTHALFVSDQGGISFVYLWQAGSCGLLLYQRLGLAPNYCGESANWFGLGEKIAPEIPRPRWYA